mmetsp:Transcript_10145/g.31042  ORF Transcript_10145/g.31042 Transcript_10145/m.31042 type:complete len:239 (-) Transcript_10145:2965-3681(-)
MAFVGGCLTDNLLNGRQRSQCLRRKAVVHMSGVVVVGAEGRLGSLAVAGLQKSGKDVLALVLKEKNETKPKTENVHVRTLDILDRDLVSSIIEERKPDAVINCLSLAFEEKTERVDYLGSVNLVDAAVNAGVKRFILVSALGAGDSESAVPAQVMDTMRPMLMDKSRSELYLKESGLEYTIIRCGPLHDESDGSAVLTTATTNCYGCINYSDLAKILEQCLDSNKAENSILTAVDTAK